MAVANVNLTKTVRIGSGESGSVFCKIEIKNGALSICGVEGPKNNGDCKGSCGQIVMHDWNIHQYAPGWSDELATKFRDVWDRWHLNDMRAGCEHQRAEGWDKRPIDPSKPTNAYGNFTATASRNMLVWVSKKDHPHGLLGEPCPTCGYKYGTAWLREELPVEVVEFLTSLPHTDEAPAWV